MGKSTPGKTGKDEEKKGGGKGNVEDIVNWEEFIVTATDSQGHTKKAQFYTTPRMLNHIDVIVAGKQFEGYKTRGGVIRHALMRHFKYLDRLNHQLGGEKLPSVVGELEAINEIMRQEQFQKEVMGVIEKMRVQVSDLISRGADDEARRRVLKIRRHIKAMPAGYWRDRCVNDVNDQFGFLLDTAERASLLKLATE